jgi:hypothetical protein
MFTQQQMTFRKKKEPAAKKTLNIVSSTQETSIAEYITYSNDHLSHQLVAYTFQE